jgi:integrase
MAHLTPTLYPDAFKKGFNARFILFMGKRLANGTHPIMLQVTQAGVSNRYGVGIACTEEQWDGHAMRIKPRVKDASERNRILNGIAVEVVTILKRLEVNGTLNLEVFRAQYRNPKATTNVLDYMAELVAKIEGDGKQGNANAYRNAARVLARFTNGKALLFAELTPSKLEKFERNLRERNCVDSTISVYMRTLRAVAGRAMKAGLLHSDAYPFETKLRPGYTMANLKGSSRPRALSEANMDKLKAFPFDEAPHLAQSVRLFIFSYYARGMSFTDIARLKRADIYDGRIHYERQKTGEEVRSIPLRGMLAEVFTALEVQGGEYALPILGPVHVTEKQRVLRIQKCQKRMNSDLKEAAALVGIPIKLTSYMARHTYATTLKRKGVDVAVVSELMGHKNVNTTRAYQARFGSDELDATDALL